MDNLLKEAQRLSNKVYRSSGGGSEMEELAMAVQSLIAYITRKFNEKDDDDYDD